MLLVYVPTFVAIVTKVGEYMGTKQANLTKDGS